jgi:uncharacterized protein YbjT (DUF2867 family)
MFPQFMNTYPVAKLAAMDKPVLEKWWAPQHKNSLINLEDLAEATTKVLLEREAHYLAEYPLCSTMPISEVEIVDIISRRIGKKVEIETPAFQDGVQRLSKILFGNSIQATNLGLAPAGDLRGDLVQDTVERLILFYNRRGLQGNPNVLRWLLGREPTTVEKWVGSIALT